MCSGGASRLGPATEGAATFLGFVRAFLDGLAAGRTTRAGLALGRFAFVLLVFCVFFVGAFVRRLRAGLAFFFWPARADEARVRRGFGEGFAFLPRAAGLRLAIERPFCFAAGQLDSVTISVVLSAAYRKSGRPVPWAAPAPIPNLRGPEPQYQFRQSID